MSQAFAPGLHIQSKYLVRKRRELPISGEMLVQEGDAVKADQVVARASLPGELLIARAAESLGIEPFEVMKGLRKSKGSAVRAGEVLVEHAGLFGLFHSRYRSPATGELEFITEKTGHLGIRLPSKQLERRAFISGTVHKIESDKSLLIETEASFVQGIFGIGGERVGKLHCLSVERDESLRVSCLPQEVQGMILLGGTAPDADFLREASTRGACGLICGAIDDKALRAYLGYDLGIALTGDEDVPMSLVITEGFGSLAMSERVLTTLKERDGSEASINGATQVRAGALRPEIIIPHQLRESSAAIDSSPSSGALEVGQRIRISRYPYFGKLARVVDLPADAQRIDTGASTRVLIAELEESNEQLAVPRANVEILS